MKKEELLNAKYTVLGMHSDYKSIPDICAATGFSRSFVSNTIHDAGKKPYLKRPRRLSQGTKDEIIRLVESGMPCASAARKVGVSDTTAQRTWREYISKTHDKQNEATSILDEAETMTEDISDCKQYDLMSPVAQIIEGLEMMLEGFKRLE